MTRIVAFSEVADGGTVLVNPDHVKRVRSGVDSGAGPTCHIHCAGGDAGLHVLGALWGVQRRLARRLIEFKSPGAAGSSVYIDRGSVVALTHSQMIDGPACTRIGLVGGAVETVVGAPNEVAAKLEGLWDA